MMKKISLIIAFVATAAITFAQTKQTVTKAAIGYQIKNMGFASTGIFSGLQANILFDKDHLTTSSIEASVDTKTVNSDDDSRDEHLRKPDFFDVEHYPKMTIKSVSFISKGGNNFIGQFDLTIKGKTKRIELPFSYAAKGNTAVFNGTLKINRLDFGVGESSMVLSNDVTILLNVETTL